MDLSEVEKKDLFTKWYNRKEILFEIVKCLSGKETSFLSETTKVRWLKAHMVDYLLKHFKAFSFIGKGYNIYYGLANVFNMPIFSYNINQRSEETKPFNLNFINYVNGYDLAFDFDVKDISFRVVKGNKLNRLKEFLDEKKIKFNMKKFEDDCNIKIDKIQLNSGELFKLEINSKDKFYECVNKKLGLVNDGDILKDNMINTAKNDCIKLKNLFNEFKVPYSLKCSGSGFHIRIDSKYLPKIDIKKKIKFCNYVGDYIGSYFDLISLCDSTYASSEGKNLWKCDYSYDVLSNNIALPLTDEQMDNFTYDIINVKNLLGENRDYFMNRGMLEREGDMKNFMKFLSEYVVLDDFEEENDIVVC